MVPAGLEQPAFYIVPKEVAALVPPHGGFVYAAVYWFHSLRDGRCTASNARIARALPYPSTVQSVSNALHLLEEKGLIKTVYKDTEKRNRLEIIPLVGFNRDTSGGVSSIHEAVYRDTSGGVQKKKRETEKVNNPASPSRKADAVEPWSEPDLAAYLDQMAEGNSAMQVIAAYLELKDVGVTRGKTRIRSKAEMQAAIRRNLRAANMLVKSYSYPVLNAVMAALADEAPFDWTLETVLKYAAHEPNALRDILVGMKPKSLTRR